MANVSSVAMDIKKMQSLLEGLKKKAVIEVGIFEGNHNARTDSGLTNAALARIHEYGSPEHGLPARSMLVTPIKDHIAAVMAPVKGKASAFLTTGTLLNLYKSIGAAAENVVDGAFPSGGYGKWTPLKENTIWRKLTRSPAGKKKSILSALKKLAQMQAGEVTQGILIRTSQLRHAFGSRIRMTF